MFQNINTAKVQEVSKSKALLSGTPSVAVGCLEIDEDGKSLRFVAHFQDKSLVELLEKAMSEQVLASRRITTFDADIYAVMMSSSGRPMAAAAFNSGWLQPVECQLRQGRYVIRHLDDVLPAPNYWSRAPGVSEMLWEKWEAKHGVSPVK